MVFARRQRSNPDIWPGFVDALATLLMVIIFLLMIFAVSQFYLSDALVGREKALESLNAKMGELADLLDLQKKENISLRTELESSVSRELGLTSDLAKLRIELDDSEAERTVLKNKVVVSRENITVLKQDLIIFLLECYFL